MNKSIPGVVLNDSNIDTLDKARKEFARLFSPDGEHSSWFDVKNKGSETEVFIYGEIGYWGVNAQDFIRQLGDVKKGNTIVLRINSPGGEVFEALAILNYLRDLDNRIVVKIDGMAASAASFLAMAGDEIIAMPNSKMMIHNARGMAFGQAEDLRVMADLLDDTSETIADIYTDRAGGEKADWLKAMKAETWYSADDMKECGLCDSIADVVKSSPNSSDDDDESVEDKCKPGKKRMSDKRVAQLGNILRIAALHAPKPIAPTKVNDAPVDDDDFDLSGFDFANAMTEAKQELDDIPWDPEQFKLIMENVRDNAPALPDPVVENVVVEDDEPIIDFSMIDAAIRAVNREGRG
jgi:ATP-dependent Clp endopeptidase proteolytic subunit ClpP